MAGPSAWAAGPGFSAIAAVGGAAGTAVATGLNGSSRTTACLEISGEGVGFGESPLGRVRAASAERCGIGAGDSLRGAAATASATGFGGGLRAASGDGESLRASGDGERVRAGCGDGVSLRSGDGEGRRAG